MKAALTKVLLTAITFAVPLRAAVFYVTVAGLGGEPDYDQRFTAAAMDLDKIFKAATNASQVFTFNRSAIHGY